LGQRILTTDVAEYPLLDIRLIALIDTSGDAVSENTPAD
jgi:hypothetical protein